MSAEARPYASANDGNVVGQHTRPSPAQPSSAGLKRSAPPLLDAHQAVKRRSSQACQTCRARKVRCDITVHGRPCTNCRLDNAECIALTSKRGPKPREPPGPPDQPAPSTQRHAASTLAGPASHREKSQSHDRRRTPSPISPAYSATQLQHDTSGERESRKQHSAPSPSLILPRAVNEVALGLTFDEDDVDEGDLDDPNRGAETNNGGPANHGPASPASLSTLPVELGLPAMHSGAGLKLRGSIVHPFLRPLRSSIGDDELMYLTCKGAFETPDVAFRDEILRSYITTIHPFMPILDLGTFLAAIFSDGKSGMISLLLYQAVMFAGLAALDPTTIQRMSFKSTKHARQVYFARIRALHDMGVESDSKALLQSLMLMSLWYGGRADQKSTWYYTGLAFSLAQHMGLHRSWVGPSAERRLRRRLWWSVYIRDRLIALGTRRPMRIRDDDFEISMLALEDFDHDAATHLHVDCAGVREALQESERGACLPAMCVKLAKLCVCIGHVLQSQYTLFGRRSPWTKALMIVPRQDLDMNQQSNELERCDKEIAAWLEGLPQEVCVATLRTESGKDAASICAARHGTTLALIHRTLISLLHRPQCLQALPSMDRTDATAQATNESRAKLKTAARELTRIANDILLRNEVRFLPISGIPALLSACLTHLLDLDSRDEDVKDAAMYRLSQLMQVLQRLRQIYASADSVITYLACVIQKSGISARCPEVATMAPEFANKQRMLAIPAEQETVHQSKHNHAVTAGRTIASSHPDASLDAQSKPSTQHVETVEHGSVHEAESMLQFIMEPGANQRGGHGDFGLSTHQVNFDLALSDAQAMFGAEDALFGGLGSLDYDLLPDLMDGDLCHTDPSFWLDSANTAN